MIYAAKPLDVSPGRRLYRVSITFPQHPAWDMDKFVLAQSPSDAADILREISRDTNWMEEPVIRGHPLMVYQIQSDRITSSSLRRKDENLNN